MKLETISRAQLELEKVSGLDPLRALCEYQNKCSRVGDYIRCFLESSENCCFYQSYKEQGR